MAVDLHDVNCPGCGAPMDGHLCPSSSGSGTPTVVREYVRGTGPRKTPSAHPDCPHCGGRIHFNMGATAINAECLWRKYLVANGRMAPTDKLPEMHLSNMLEMAEWYENQIRLGQSFDYGKSGGGTYSTRRKTPVLTPASTTPAFPPVGGGIPVPAGATVTSTSTPTVAMPAPKVKPYVQEKEEPAKEPAKEPTKDELRAKRRELLKVRNKK